MNPAVLIIVSIVIGLNDPNFEIIKPEVGPNTRSTRANGN